MFKGILAEASCKVGVINKLDGWQDITEPGQSYDFKITDGKRVVTIQVKLQRKLKGIPMTANKATGLSDPSKFVVETQKTRTGTGSDGESTRPYRFGEFDIVAVAMEPSTHDWAQFRFTLSRWLKPRAGDKNLVAVYQPVSLQPNDEWTDQLAIAIEWLGNGVQKTISG